LPNDRALLLGELHAMPAQGGQTLAPRQERNVLPGLVQPGGELSAENPGTVRENFHGF
jgi:hypothetical protein